MKKERPWLCAALAALIFLGSLALRAAAEETPDVSALYKSRDVDASWSAASAERIDLNAAQGQTLAITAPGDYVLSGAWQGQILIEAAEEDKVRLILSGASITSPQGPAIYEKQADQLILTLEAGTDNFLSDGPALTDGDDTIGAALYAEDDLSINGSGALTLTGTQKHGLQSKKDLVIAGGVLSVTAPTDGIRARNSCLILDGDITVTAGGDGVVTTRTDQEGKGWIVLAGGSLTVKTGDGAGTPRASANSRGGMDGPFGRGGRERWGRPEDDGSLADPADSGTSQKAVKAAADLTVWNGVYAFDCADDGLHAVRVTVNGGVFTIRTGDDGMHADSDLTVNGGIINLAQCYEGLEGRNVTINGGEIAVTASDDAVNAAGGSDQSGFGGWGRDRFNESDSGSLLAINGGTLSVSAGGDGLDSNGSIAITGGITCVWAATTMGEGAIDFNGSGTITGGTLIVASTGGVLQGLTGQSVMALSAGSARSGEITLLDGSGATLAAFAPASAYDTVMVSSDRLAEGENCAVFSQGQALYSGAMTHNIDSGAGRFGGPGRNRKGW